MFSMKRLFPDQRHPSPILGYVPLLIEEGGSLHRFALHSLELALYGSYAYGLPVVERGSFGSFLEPLEILIGI